jgi:alpha-beta hydrolase superfamily lysophospholipase
MNRLVALALLAAMLGAGTATAAKPKPPRLQDYCVTRAERKNNAVQFKAADGATLRGVLLGPRTSRRGVVIAHEGAGGLCNWLPYGRRLARLGYRVLVFDLRGFVSSPRTRQRQGRHDLDVVGAARELRRRGIRRVALVGGSLGAMAVVAAAPQITPAVDGIIVASPGLVFRDLDAGAAAPGVRVPALFVASTDDGEFPSSTRTIYERAASTDKRLVLVPGTRHGYELVLSGDVASNRALFEEFLGKHLS